jgi:hypothetical protein
MTEDTQNRFSWFPAFALSSALRTHRPAGFRVPGGGKKCTDPAAPSTPAD